MLKSLKTTVLLTALLFVLFLTGRAEEVRIEDIPVDSTMTLAEIALTTGVPVGKLLKGLNLEQSAASMRLYQTGSSAEKASSVIRKIKIIQATEKAKDWRLILSKFALWLFALTAATVLLMKGKTNSRLRPVWMAGTALLFGFILGSDPNPMGTVKDAIVLYGREGVLFPPRMVALAVFLGFVLVSNKAICGWGCHFGALQDILHHLPVKKIRLPFWLTNDFRVLVLASVILAAIAWGLDWVGEIDPFKVFNISSWDMGLAGLIFTVSILVFGMFFYRPWCQLFCPFGLAGWLAEQFSLLRPVIDRKGCLKCRKCVQVCPSQAMSGIYHDKKLRADCFACGECLRQCPAQVINWKHKPSDKELK